MSIKISKHTIGVWNLQITADSDWLCSAWHQDGLIHMKYRFRYYQDKKAFDSKDDKSWWRAQATSSPDEIIKAFREMMQMLKQNGAIGEPYELLMRDFKDKDAFIDEFLKAPFAHVRRYSKEEYEQLVKEGKAPPMEETP